MTPAFRRSGTSAQLGRAVPAGTRAQLPGRLQSARSYPVDSRGLAYTYAFIGIKRLGAGQFYLIAIKDKDGNAFDGSTTYKLTVPPDVPIEQDLVGDRLRPRDTRADPQHGSRQPLLADPRAQEKRRRLDRHLFRARPPPLDSKSTGFQPTRIAEFE